MTVPTPAPFPVARWSRAPRTRSIAVLCAAALLCACAPNGDERARGTVAQRTDGVRVDVPVQLRAVEPASLRLTVTLQALDGASAAQTFELAGRDAGEPWEVRWRVAPGVPTRLTLSWYDVRDESVELILATYSTELSPVRSSGPVAVSSVNYVTAEHDMDRDGYSNLDERRCDSVPSDPESVPLASCDAVGGMPPPTDPGPVPDGDPPPDPIEIEVEISGIAPGTGPRIDGRYFDTDSNDPANPDGMRASAWDRGATFDDTDGNRLAIARTMIVRGDGPWVETPGYRWFALHDGTTLFVFVQGKEVGAPLFGDSAEIYNDDALNLFIDGNNSKGMTYDGVDDWHVFIALTDGAGGPNTETRRVAAGPNSAGVPAGLRVETCICTSGTHTWELAVPLASVGIELGESFGFELQIDEDNDGGDRDARFGWAHPSRADEDVDFTFREPRFMGTARLL